MAKDMREPIESGCPDGFQYMHPVMRRNFGLWKFHEHPRPGVLKHVAINGDECWTVRAGTQRILDLFTLQLMYSQANPGSPLKRYGREPRRCFL